MRRPLADTYDEGRVASIAAEVAEAIDAAALGVVPWDAIPQTLGKAFPGAMVSFSNENLVAHKLHFVSVHNIDPDFQKSYQDYYAYINPWESHWYSAENGKVLVAEEHCPARLLSRTEFYNDWLMPQRELEAAVGIKIENEGGDLVRMPMHYSPTLASVYDHAAAEVLKRIRGCLRRSLNAARLLRDRTEETVARAALVERARCAAFVVDGDLRLRDANEAALGLLSSGRVAVKRHGRVRLIDHHADGLLCRAVSALSHNLPTDLSRIPVRDTGRNWQVSLAALPAVAGGEKAALSLFPEHSMVLVLIRDMKAISLGTGNLTVLSTQFGLTPAEVLFCERLAQGDSLSEVADFQRIAYETARNRIKTIFHKTGTHRQGELLLMLATLS